MATTSDLQRHGSCFCGRTQVDVTGAPMFAGLCYCTECQKSSGVIMQSNAVYLKQNVKVTNTSDEPLGQFASNTNDSGSTKTKTFCKNCGTTIHYNSNGRLKDMFIIPMGILDKVPGQDLDLKPGVELYCERRVSWFPGVEGLPKHDKSVPSFDFKPSN